MSADSLTHTAPTIRSRLTLLVLACVVPVSLMLASWAFYDYQNDRAELVQQSIARAGAMVSVVDRELAGDQAALLALATSPYIAAQDWPAFYAQARQVQRAMNVSSIALVDRALVQRINTRLPMDAPIAIAEHAWLKPVFASGTAVTTDIFPGTASKQLTIAVAVPVMRNGDVAYVLYAAIRPERMAASLQKEKLPPEWIASIFDSSGSIVARSRNMDKFVGTQGSAVLVARMKEVPEDSIENKTLEGIPVIEAFSRSAVSNWTVAIGIPSQQLLGELWKMLAWILGLTVLVLIASVGMAWLIAGSIARPIAGLTRAARLLGSGGEVVIGESLGLREADEVGAELVRTSQKLLHAEHRAHHDGLTGLPNRVLFHEIAKLQIEVCRREGGSLSMLFIDLDGFKRVNDEYGHDIGDRLLCAVATRLQNTLRGSDVAARLGGDEFAGLLVHTSVPAAAQVAGKLVDALSAPYMLGDVNLQVSASIGVATYPGSGSTSEELLLHADEAMYKVKFDGKRGYAVAPAFPTAAKASAHLASR
jgi:diguanylate cyclase (GGDEF)-like protein